MFAKTAPFGIAKEYFKNMPKAVTLITQQTYQHKSTHKLPLWYAWSFQFMEEHLQNLLKENKIGCTIMDGLKNIVPFTKRNQLYRRLEKQVDQTAKISWRDYQASWNNKDENSETTVNNSHRKQALAQSIAQRPLAVGRGKTTAPIMPKTAQPPSLTLDNTALVNHLIGERKSI